MSGEGYWQESTGILQQHFQWPDSLRSLQSLSPSLLNRLILLNSLTIQSGRNYIASMVSTA